MNCHGITVDIRHQPSLDRAFIPMHRFNQAFLKTARMPFGLAVERADGEIAVCRTYLHGTPERAEADFYYAERLAKTLLWVKGGFRLYVCGSQEIFEALKRAYAPDGIRAFDAAFMARVYEHPFEVVSCASLPEEKNTAHAVGRHLDGCRIGFDAGGSDRKVSAVIDGESVYSEEVVWSPKTEADPEYHYRGIVDAFRSAAAHMPRVDAIGVSSAGIYIDNRAMVASLFLSVPEALFDAKVKDIYLRAAGEFGDVPIVVANDGDVTALAGAMSLEDNNVLGIAMGTSEAVGYVDAQGNITGWLNELAFAPVDASPDAMADEWSGDIGCGVKYFSQDAVIKLAPRAGITLPETLTPAEKLREIQRLAEEGHGPAGEIFTSIGVYLAHTLAFYHGLYGFRHVLLLGRVMSGRGGELLADACRTVLREEYPEVEKAVDVTLPNEKFRRMGQSVAAASLPELRRP